jgi:hypothetical protein
MRGTNPFSLNSWVNKDLDQLERDIASVNKDFGVSGNLGFVLQLGWQHLVPYFGASSLRHSLPFFTEKPAKAGLAGL